MKKSMAIRVTRLTLVCAFACWGIGLIVAPSYAALAEGLFVVYALMRE